MKRTLSGSRIFLQWMFLAGVLVFGSDPAQAAFIGAYSPANFTLTNSNADGSAITPDGGLSLVVTGGNNGTALPGTTDFTILAPVSGLISFNYQFSACDVTNVCDTPGFDSGFYLLGPNATFLADTTGQSGSVSLAVTGNQLFGFRVSTMDNTGEPGILTITNFSGPQSTAAVPEPYSLGAVCGGLLLIVAIGCARSRRRPRLD